MFKNQLTCLNKYFLKTQRIFYPNEINNKKNDKYYSFVAVTFFGY